MPTPQQQALRSSVEAAAKAATAVNDKVLALALAQRDDDARALLLSDMMPLNDTWLKTLNTASDAQQQSSSERVAQASATFERGLWTIALVALAAAAFAAWAGWFISRSIARPIQYARPARLQAQGLGLEGEAHRLHRHGRWQHGNRQAEVIVVAVQDGVNGLCRQRPARVQHDGLDVIGQLLRRAVHTGGLLAVEVLAQRSAA